MEGLTAATKSQRPESGAAASATGPGRPPDDDEGLETRELGPSPSEDPDAHAPIDKGAALGRYFPIAELGRGGMGRVLRAYDPKLQREVALKVLNANAVGVLGWARLVREAQTMARLNHPHVVSIHDIDDDPRHGVVLAMELVEGTTLRQWLREKPRRWDEILEAFIEAGRGLAAAHREGLLHRDFKPANVLVARDGQGGRGPAKVTDFGLAKRTGDDRTTGDVLASMERATPKHLDETLTEHGMVMGTPFYMAPEQHRGARLTSAADQFSFCVALWEALFGERPFAGRNGAEVAVNMLEGRLRPPPKRRVVPSWLRRACERGLAVDPRQRWPSMEVLLATLVKGRTRARMRKGLVAVGVLALLVAGGEGYRRHALAQRIVACEASREELGRAWSPAREQALRDALVATGASYAATTTDKVIPLLEQQAEEWQRLRVEVCLETEVRERWDADTLDRSLWCLDERRMQLESLVDELTLADAEVLQKAVTAAMGLTPVIACGDPSALAELAPPPEDSRPAIRAVRDDVTRVDNLGRAGHYDEAVVLARATLARAEELHWQPMSALARYRLGEALEAVGAYAEAETRLEDAYFEADRGVAPEVAFDAAVDLVAVVGYSLARPGEGRRWARHAESALTELHGDDSLRRSRLLAYLAYTDEVTSDYARAQVRYEQALALRQAVLGPTHPQVAALLQDSAGLQRVTGHYDRAKALYERALAIDQAALGPDHPDVAGALSNLAVVLLEMGEYEESKALTEQSIALYERALGPDHIKVGLALNNLSSVFHATGAIDEAVAVQQRVVAILAASLGPEDPQLARALSNLAAFHHSAGDQGQAEALNRRVLAIREQAFGPDHPDVATSLDNLANAHQGGPVEVLALRERALAIREKAFGSDHPNVAVSLINIAGAHQAAGAYAEATGGYERALAVLERAFGPDHPSASDPLLGLAEIAMAQERPADAVRLAERALTLQEQSGAVASALARPRFVLAQALWGVGGDGGRERAVRLAEVAREGYAAAGGGSTDGLAEVERWLADHPIAR